MNVAGDAWLIILVVFMSIELIDRNPPGVVMDSDSRFFSLRLKQLSMYRLKWERNTPEMQHKTIGLRHELRKESTKPMIRQMCQNVL